MDTTNEITPEDSVVPVYLEPMSEEDRLAILAEQEAFIAQQQAIADARQSALAKLESLGLTQEEINALTGGS
jgi:hypothetical protein